MLTGFLSCVGLWKIFTFSAIYYYNVSSFICIYEHLYAITFVIRKNKCFCGSVP